MPDFKSDCYQDFQVDIDGDLILNLYGYGERDFDRFCKLDV